MQGELDEISCRWYQLGPGTHSCAGTYPLMGGTVITGGDNKEGSCGPGGGVTAPWEGCER